MASRYSGALTAYRIASRHYPLLDGGRAFKFGSRWCTPGRYIIHAAFTYSLAVLENIVHWQAALLPPDQHYVQITIPPEVSRRVVVAHDVLNWDAFPYGPSQEVGDRWYDSQESAVLIVPSVLSPFEPNVLLNQRHPQFGVIAATDPQPAVLDKRLFTRSTR